MGILQEGQKARELQVASTIKKGVNGETVNLNPGDHIVELEPKGVFRLTNDVHNRMFTLAEDQMGVLIDTGEKDDKLFSDTSS
jgi:hypothetical protein